MKKDLIIQNEPEVFEIYLTPEKYPHTFQKKVFELINSGLTKEEAENELKNNPIVLELVYEIDNGLFAIESEAIGNTDLYSPYTRKEVICEDDVIPLF